MHTPSLSFHTEKQCGILRPVSEIPKQLRSIFKAFPYFNYIQSKALDDVLYSDKNFVMCAPTGSGKTVIFEMAIVRLLMEEKAPWTNLKIVYMAPIKALCSQRFDDWKEKFEPIGLSCKELTGDTEMDDLFEIQHTNIITTTPEKWDSMSRRWRDNTLIQLVRLFLIDEVHTVKDESRGATLEVVVSRMKTMQASPLCIGKCIKPQPPMRFVAVSATVPNADDIAEWLSDGECQAMCMKMNESHRPVKLRKVVIGFPSGSNQTEYKFDLTLNYKVPGIIQTYSNQKPTLVFCATRKGVQQAASILAKDAKFSMSVEHKQRLQKWATAIKDGKLREVVLYGVGYHHAGMDISDRKKMEAAFTSGDLPVLFTTSTLAMGVNLPAHLVIIKSTMHYASGMCQEYSETDILQMIGRAGRPQFDSTATAVIMTRLSTKEKYVQMLHCVDTIESSLHRHLVEHLNAEIALHTIADGNIALEWIRSTFLYIRSLKNPSHYGFEGVLDKMGIESKLQELCLKNLNDLSSIGLIQIDEDVNFKPTETGKLIAQYYIAFDTARLFYSVNGKETLAELVTMISACKEFSDIQLRTSEKKVLNTLNKDKYRTTIRFPLEGKIKSREMKVNCLIQAQLGCIHVQDFSLTQDMAKIFRQGVRVTKCLYEFLALQEKKFIALLHALILTKCFRCKLWEDSLHVSKQLDKIGVSLANAMVNAGLTSFEKIENTNPRELELIVNRHPPFGNQIKESVLHLPKYELRIEQLPKCSSSVAEIVVTVLLTNFERLQKKRTAPDSHYITFVIGDSENNVVFRQKIVDSAFFKSGTWTRKIEVRRVSTSDELSFNLISSEYVGLDIHQTFRAVYSGFHKSVENGDWNCEITWKSKSPLDLEFADFHSMQTVLKACMRECNHNCKNKEACGHDCCKTGVSHKSDSKTNANFSSYLSDLRSRNAVSSAPPVKRLKVQMQGEVTTNLQMFAFMPKPSMNSCLCIHQYRDRILKPKMESAGTGCLEVRINQLQSTLANMHAEMQTLTNKYDAFEGQTSHNVHIYGQTIQELRGTVQTLSDRMAHLEAQASVLPTSVPAMSPKLPPFRFGGDRDKFRGFLNQCRLYFDANPTQFPTDRSKVLCIIMLLTHKAIAWASPLIETQDPRLNNLEDFINAMSQMFDDPNRGATAEAALLALRQGRRPVTEYAMEFKRWAIDTDWNDAAKMSFFRKGLSSALKDELARAEAPLGLDDFINHCIRIDTRLSERRQEKWATLNFDTKQSPSFPVAISKEPQGKIQRESGSEPMQSMKIHPVFHVSLLKPVVLNPFPERIPSPPDAVEVDGQEQFIVEEILDSRIFRNQLQYLIKWQGYGPEENSWEPIHGKGILMETTHGAIYWIFRQTKTMFPRVHRIGQPNVVLKIQQINAPHEADLPTAALVLSGWWEYPVYGCHSLFVEASHAYPPEPGLREHDQQLGSTGSLSFGNTFHGNQQSKSSADFQKLSTVTSSCSSGSVKQDNVTFDLGQSWDDLDDDSLIDASNFFTSKEVTKLGPMIPELCCK
ncbi:putative ATP-dependent DNA helicase HFM1 [Gastrophryne carolinensis]